MYNRITFENYKIFKNSQSLEIKPITVLFGKNNAGKSAVLNLPLLLASGFKGTTSEVLGQEFNQRYLYADIRDLVYNRANRALKIGVFDDINERSLEFSFFVDNDQEVKSHIEYWKYRNSDMVDVRSDVGHEVNFLFDGLFPRDYSVEKRLDLKGLNTFVDYIGNVRVVAERDMRISPITECSGWQGEKGYAHMLKDALLIQPELGPKVSRWFQETFPGWKIKVDSSGSPVFHVNVVNGNVETNIADAGFGISQSLPIVIRACRLCSQPTLIVLEEPEAHLHPAAQGNLGELIAMSTLEDLNKHYLIETHSFNFILRLRALIASGMIKKENVALYFVDYSVNENSSNLRRVSIDEKGRVSNWPIGVFEETYDEVVRIHNAKRQRK